MIAAVARIEIHPQSVRFAVHRSAIPSAIAKGLEVFAADPSVLEITAPVRFKLRGGETRLIQPEGKAAWGARRHDATLIKGLRSAHRLIQKLGANPTSSLDQLRQASCPGTQYERRLSALAFLAPDIQEAIVGGRQPAELTLDALMKIKLPLAWSDQRNLLGFNRSTRD